MKAAVYERYGLPDVITLKEVMTPTPKKNEVLIKIFATTVTSGDWRVRSLSMPPGFGFMARFLFGISKPRQPVLGTELAGEVVSVGKDVSNLKPGDQVIAFNYPGMGCHAEYKCMSSDGLVALKPINLTYEEAVAISFGGTTALGYLRKGKLKGGEKVLVNGASGGVGTAVVQLAKHFGAEVTGVCSSSNAEMVRSLGAVNVIDYTKEDFTQNGETYDVIVDTAGTAPFTRSKGSLKEGGRLLIVLGGLSELLRSPLASMTGSKKVIATPAAITTEDLRFLVKLATEGTFKPVIDRCFPFEQISEAHRYVDKGHKKGNVVVTLRQADRTMEPQADC